MEIRFSLFTKQDADHALSAITALRSLLLDSSALQQWGQAQLGHADAYAEASDPTQSDAPEEGQDALAETFSKEDAKAAMAALAGETVKAKRTRRTKAEMEAERAAQEGTQELETVSAATTSAPSGDDALLAMLGANFEPVEQVVTMQQDEPVVETTVEDPVTEEIDGVDGLLAAFGIPDENEEPAEYRDLTIDELRQKVVAKLKEPAYGAKWVAGIMKERGVVKPGDLTRADMIAALQTVAG